MKQFWQLHPTVKWRMVDQLLGNIVGNMIWPFMVIYLADQFGAGLAGLLLSLNIFLSLLVGFYGGFIADRFGRKRMMTYAESGRLLAFLVMVFANSPWLDSSVLTFGMMTISTLMSGLLRPAGQAMLIDASTPEDRRLIYGLDYWSMNIAILVGSLVGGFWFQTHRFALLSGLAVSSVLSLLILLVFIRETMVPAVRQAVARRPSVWQDLWANYRIVLLDRVFLLFLIATVLDMSIEFSMRNVLAVHLKEVFGTQALFGWATWSFTVDGVAMFGILMMVNTLTVLLLMALVGRLTKQIRERVLLQVGLLVYAVGFGVLAMVQSAWVLIGFMVLGTLGELVYVPVRQSLMANLVPADRRSSYLAVNSVTFRGSMMIGSLSVSVASVSPTWSIGAMLILFGVISFLVFRMIFARQDESGAVVQQSTAMSS
ncbi:MFS transporter [Tumebacillus permanentifrigoris]|uniref:DHA1 family multidrug resistance protein B-like MFS transporter n=1 Tax=Tumebacillus permanentifrigoris TaxID=378543 RepID=A0A316DCR4_9BACL|nr:MFS transporter [Tumebacillus permanentifrigoris]PWK13105.1 DHA1 family multidrug resistance protein B-like MFS transporter [Tumebacillus permanentifrigoris]